MLHGKHCCVLNASCSTEWSSRRLGLCGYFEVKKQRLIGLGSASSYTMFVCGDYEGDYKIVWNLDECISRRTILPFENDTNVGLLYFEIAAFLRVLHPFIFVPFFRVCCYNGNNFKLGHAFFLI